MSEWGDIYGLRLHEKAYHLYTRGYTYRQIALQLYGSDEDWAINRVKNLLHRARKNYDVQLFEQGLEMFNEVMENGLRSAQSRSGKDRYKRQWMEHQNLIYYLLTNIGIPPYDPVVTDAVNIHARVFPRLWKKYGYEKLRVWKNGGDMHKFSFTWHSLAYAYAVAMSTLISWSLNHKKRHLYNLVMNLVPERKRRQIQKFKEAHQEISGYVYDSVLGPQFIF